MSLFISLLCASKSHHQAEIKYIESSLLLELMYNFVKHDKRAATVQHKFFNVNQLREIVCLTYIVNLH